MSLEEKTEAVNSQLSYCIHEFIYKELKFEYNLIGSYYLCQLIEYLIKENIYLYKLSPTKEIYPLLSEKFDTNTYKVERAIRYSCAEEWKYIDDCLKKRIFPTASNKVPTNSEMISGIYEYIKAHHMGDYVINKNGILKNNLVIQKNENLINYKIRFEIEQFLFQKFGLRYNSLRQLPILIDAIMMSVKMNKILTDEDIEQILKKLNDIYALYEGESYNYKDCLVRINEAENIVLRLCKRLYEQSNESFCLKKPKNKTYIKEYMNVLSLNIRNNLPFYI